MVVSPACAAMSRKCMGALEDVIEMVWPVLCSVRGDGSVEDGSWARQREAARVPRTTIRCFGISNRRIGSTGRMPRARSALRFKFSRREAMRAIHFIRMPPRTQAQKRDRIKPCARNPVAPRQIQVRIRLLSVNFFAARKDFPQEKSL
jgi:hypothetical protein